MRAASVRQRQAGSRPERRAHRPLWLARSAARQAARRRMVARTRSGLSAQQRAHDPLAHRRRGAGARAGLGAVLLLAAAVVHVAAVAVGFVVGGRPSDGRRRVEQPITVEMHEAPPAPAPIPPPRARADEHRAPPKPRAIVEAPPPRPHAPAPPPAAASPPRVVGISLDATVEGGEGPAFATGDTHLGQTADRAEASRPPVAAPSPPRAPAAGHNQVASHIPIAGVQLTPPRRKHPREPRYPEALKAQEIEADVTVMVSIDAHGTVTSVDVIRPALYPEFNQVAEEAARQEAYEPALRDGVPVPDRLSYTYRFRLDTK